MLAAFMFGASLAGLVAVLAIKPVAKPIPIPILIRVTMSESWTAADDRF